MLRSMQILLWRTSALCALFIGFIGLAVPVMPTVPFVIFAAFAAGKGWPALDRWLSTHPTYGTHICNWRDHGAVSRKAKLLALAMMLLGAVTLQFVPVPVPLWLRVGIPLIMLLIAIWLCLRPEKCPHA
jgi:uncharacterized membrane protein YbaN (DUF454 family)